MAQISSYPIITPQFGDKVLGSNIYDSSGNPVTGNPTCQYDFTSIKTLVDQNWVEQFTSSSSVTSQASTVNQAYNIRFGAPTGAGNSNVQLLQGGGSGSAADKIQFNTTGTYQIILTYSVGVISDANAVPYLIFRTLQDGTTQVGPTVVYNQKFEGTYKPVPLIIPITVNITIPCYYNFQMAKNVVDEGGLVKNGTPINSGITPAVTTPSIATIKISKLV